MTFGLEIAGAFVGGFAAFPLAAVGWWRLGGRKWTMRKLSSVILGPVLVPPAKP